MPDRYVVVKRNKRLFVDDMESGDVVYTPPDFLRHKMNSRDQIKALAASLSAGVRYIDAVIEFETNARPLGRSRLS